MSLTGAEGSPSLAPSLPSLSSPSCQETSLPIPSSGLYCGGREMARGFLAWALELPFSVLWFRALIPGVVPPLAPKPLWLQVPQPRSITVRGTWLLSPQKPLDVRACPPGPVPCHLMGATLPQSCLVLQAPLGASQALGQHQHCCAWPESIPCSSPGAGTVVSCACPGFGVLCWGVPPAWCSPTCPSPGTLAPSWQLGSGLGRWRVVISLHHLQPFLYKLIKENTGKKPSQDGVASFVFHGMGKGEMQGGTGL